MENKDNKTYIKTMKINLTLMSPFENEEDIKKYNNEVYSYLRDAIWAQNRAMNIVLDRTKEAFSLGRGMDRVKEIYFSYSHQKPIPTDKKESFLERLLQFAPIDEVFVEKEVANLRKFYEGKKKPPKEETILKNCEATRKKYLKYIGKSKEDIQKELKRIENYCAYPEDVYEKFANGLSTPAYVKQKVEAYWKQDGVKTKVIYSLDEKLRYVKGSTPLFLPPNVFYRKNKAGSMDLMGLIYDYDNYLDFLNDLEKKRSVNLYLNIPYKKGEPKLKFKLILGNPHKSHELRLSLKRIFEREYTIKGSSIGFTKNKETGKKTNLTLYLTVEIPQNNDNTLDENVVVGVDVGVAIPCACALNNDKYPREYIGNYKSLFGKRKQFKEQRSRLNKQLTLAKGGHGRKRKLSALERLSYKERNYADTECRKYAKQVIKFCLKYHAKYINLENLKGYKESPQILEGWNFYKIQSYIEQAAIKHGIIVRKIIPCYTSQVCSECGCYHPDNRPKGKKGQSYFYCHNEFCDTHKSDYEVNADYNAARNIAMSTLFVSGSNEITEKDKKKAREYYGIPEPETKENEEVA